MCGRYVSPAEAEIERAWHIGRHNNEPFARHFNVAPTASVPILRRDPGSGELELMIARWGLVPYWWKEAKPPRLTHNARVEEAASRPMWRQPLRDSRCLVPAQGWYEWRKINRTDPQTGEISEVKQPNFLRLRDGGLFCFAGLVTLWTPPGKETPLPSCTILTRDASASVADVHDRMPVVLQRDAHDAWLDPELIDAEKAGVLARERAMTEFEYFPVSTRVNVAKNDDSDLIAPLPAGVLFR